jgi:hypothetical protein
VPSGLRGDGVEREREERRRPSLRSFLIERFSPPRGAFFQAFGYAVAYSVLCTKFAGRSAGKGRDLAFRTFFLFFHVNHPHFSDVNLHSSYCTQAVT